MNSERLCFSKKIIIISTIGVVFSIILLLSALSFRLPNTPILFQAKRVKLVVFIHGTVASTLNIFGSDNLSGDACDEFAPSVQIIKKFRNYQGMGYDQIIGQEGLHEFHVPQALPSVTDVSLDYAAQYLIPIYDDLARTVLDDTDVQNYAIFGWSGLLHNAARKKAGYELYHALCNYRDNIRAHYGIEPEITLVTHSHGGNVALYMDCAQAEFKKNLKIKYLVMFGTPMMHEMAPCLESDMFATMLMLYSKGDSIQARDIFSSKNKKSYKRMTDIINAVSYNEKAQNAHLKRYDICCSVKGDYKKITHTNMWLMGRSKSIIPSMKLLPFMVLTPVLLECIGMFSEKVSAPFLSLEFRIAERDNMLNVRIIDKEHNERITFEQGSLLHERLMLWDGHLRSTWQKKDDMIRHPLFNKKNLQAFKHAWWS